MPCELLNLTPQFLSNTGRTSIDLDFKISPQNKNLEESNQVIVQARELELRVYDQSSFQDNFWKAGEAIRDSSAEKQRGVATMSEDAC
jgi:predicted nucleotidyltransferase component of viral defense system